MGKLQDKVVIITGEQAVSVVGWQKQWQRKGLSLQLLI